ncbi:MAG: hypothetical protein ABW277_03960 [Longimicrobiaceae bacterium]
MVYITTKGQYLGHHDPHWRLTAILRVLRRFDTHLEAADWFRKKNLPLPNNCMVPGTEPFPLEKTAGPTPQNRFTGNPQSIISKWDAFYRARVSRCGTFLVCDPEFRELNHPPIITERMMREVFGRLPATRNPPVISREQFDALRVVAGLAGRRSEKASLDTWLLGSTTASRHGLLGAEGQIDVVVR